MESNRYFQTPVITGLIFGIVSILITVFLGGAGHGTFTPAKILFPFTMLSTYNNEPINLGFILIALVQYPTYGLIMGFGTKQQKRFMVFLLISTIHLTAVILAFNFSGNQF